MVKHMSGNFDKETLCGRMDHRNKLGETFVPPLAKVHSWAQVTCKRCQKIYVHPNGTAGLLSKAVTIRKGWGKVVTIRKGWEKVS